MESDGEQTQGWSTESVDIKVKPVKCGEVFTVDHQNYILICSLCEEPFQDTLQFGSHYQEKHVPQELESNYPPTLDSKTEEDQSELKENTTLDFTIKECSIKEEYVEETHDEDATTSNIACKQEEDVSYEKLYKLVKKSDVNLCCDLCDHQTPDEKSLRSHLTIRHNQVTCDYCDEMFASQEELEEHTSSHDKDQPYGCTYCLKSYRSKRGRQSHVSLSHKNEQHPKCAECGKSFLTKGRLQIHSQKHSTPELLTCEICRRHFTDASEKYDHICIDTDEKPFKFLETSQPCIGEVSTNSSQHDEQNRFQCVVCEKKFRSKCKLVLHLTTHYAGKQLECPDCSQKFYRCKDFQIHYKAHLRKKQFECAFCARIFKHPGALTNHQKTHTMPASEELFPCELCGKSFNIRNSLVVHIRRNHSKKDYECTVCGNTFYTSYSLKIHSVTHFTDRPLQCPDCDHKFPTLNSLRMHFRKHLNMERHTKSEVC